MCSTVLTLLSALELLSPYLLPCLSLLSIDLLIDHVSLNVMGNPLPMVGDFLCIDVLAIACLLALDWIRCLNVCSRQFNSETQGSS